MLEQNSGGNFSLFKVVKIGLDKRVETFLPEKQDCQEFPTDKADNWLGCMRQESRLGTIFTLISKTVPI